jgi:hypothetical protein
MFELLKCILCGVWVLKLISFLLDLKDIHGRGDAIQRKTEPVDSYQCAGKTFTFVENYHRFWWLFTLKFILNRRS